jgi:tetratricopeptide (TPR) repeat protein
MNKAAHLLLGLGMALSIASNQTTLAAVLQGKNAISGTVFGNSRPMADVYVELVDDVYSTVGRMRTDGSGRFSFTGLGEGRYKVKALPYGTEYLEQTQEVVLASVSATAGSGSDRQYIDIYLRVDQRLVSGPFAVTPGVVFVQEVPETARKLYRAGLSFLGQKKDMEGLDSIKRAIEEFPTYFDALDRLGREYALRGASDRNYYVAALVLLTKANEVNSRSFPTVFGLGWTQYQLGMIQPAVDNLTRATTLYGKSADPYLWLGKALRRASTLDQAEVALKRANDLAKGKTPEVHWQLAGLYRDQKRYKEAADELELFLKAEPKAADAPKIREMIKQLREKTDGVNPT